MTVLTPYFHGFAVGVGLIVAIGAQNAFVLRQGIRKQHVLWVVLTCCICDAALIGLGAFGVGELLQQHGPLLEIIRWLGVAFLSMYGIKSLWAALRSGSTLLIDGEGQRLSGLRPTLALTLAITLLNPHVYLDTVILIGTISTQHDGLNRKVFTAGAMSASFVWFFSLGYGAKFLSPLFEKPRTWQVLEIIIAAIMFSLAILLATSTIT